MQYRQSIVSARIPRSLHELLLREAALRNMSASALIERALESALGVQPEPIRATFEPGDLSTVAEVTTRKMARDLGGRVRGNRQ